MQHVKNYMLIFHLCFSIQGWKIKINISNKTAHLNLTRRSIVLNSPFPFQSMAFSRGPSLFRAHVILNTCILTRNIYHFSWLYYVKHISRPVEYCKKVFLDSIIRFAKRTHFYLRSYIFYARE